LGVLPALLLSAAPAAADTAIRQPPDLCAALWEGYADVLGDEGERALAARFRDASAALLGPEETDALIAERRPWMADLVIAYIEFGDEQSRDLFERLLQGCALTEADLLRPQ
jgi:hypothetical protein